MPWADLGDSGEKWIRGRYGVDGDGKAGLWIAVESNLGLIKEVVVWFSPPSPGV